MLYFFTYLVCPLSGIYKCYIYETDNPHKVEVFRGKKERKKEELE